MAARIHRDTARNVVVGVVVVIALVVVVGLGMRPILGGELVGAPYTYVTADFADVGALKEKAEVRINSAQAGKVAKIDDLPTGARVLLRLDGDVPVYRNAGAQIFDKSPLSQQFVDLTVGTPDAGPLGDTPIAQAATQPSPNDDEVFNVFDPQTRTSLRSSMKELGTGLAGGGQDVRDLVRPAANILTDLQKVSAAASRPDAALGPLLAKADSLTGHLSGESPELKALIAQADTTLAALNTDGGKPLAASMQKAPATLRQARAALDSLDQPLGDVESATRDLRSGGQALGDATPDVRAVLRDGVEPLNKVPDVAELAEPAVSDLTDAVHDLRPLIPQVRETVHQADILLRGLSPYAVDLGLFFAQKDLLSGEFRSDQHYFSAIVQFPGLYNASLPDPLAKRDPYPFATPIPRDQTLGYWDTKDGQRPGDAKDDTAERILKATTAGQRVPAPPGAQTPPPLVSQDKSRDPLNNSSKSAAKASPVADHAKGGR